MLYTMNAFIIYQEIAERVNTGDLPSDSSQSAPVVTVPLPQVFEFAMAAIAAPQVVSDTSTTTDSGAMGLSAHDLSVVLVSVVAAVAVMCMAVY